MAGSISGIASTLADVARGVGKVALAPFRTVGNLAGSAMSFGGSRMGIGGGDVGSNFSSPSGSFADVSSGLTGSNFNLNLSNQVNADRLAAASLGGISPSAVTTTGVVGMGNMSNTRGFTPQGGRGSVGGTSGTPAASSSVSAKTAREQAAQKAKDDKVDTRVQNTATRTELAAQGIGLDVPEADVEKTGSMRVGVDAAGNPALVDNLQTFLYKPFQVIFSS